jgi:hypothetical protein
VSATTNAVPATTKAFPATAMNPMIDSLEFTTRTAAP